MAYESIPQSYVDGFEVAARDEVFHAALKGRDNDWSLRAVAGYVTRQACRDAESRDLANRHGLSRALTEDERAAWTFGFTWAERTSH